LDEVVLLPYLHHHHLPINHCSSFGLHLGVYLYLHVYFDLSPYAGGVVLFGVIS
jgi:hypothetical protein